MTLTAGAPSWAAASPKILGRGVCRQGLPLEVKEAARMLLSLGATVEVGQWEADHLNTDHSLGANNEPVSPRDVALAMHHDACVRVIDEVLALRRAR